MEYTAKYYLVDIDGTITNYYPGAVTPANTLGGNFLFPIIRDMMVERGWDREKAGQAILDYANKVIYWDYTDFIAEFNLPAKEAFDRMKAWHTKNLYAYPETVKLIKKLHADGKKLFIMSNNPYVGCIFKLQIAGLADDDFSSPYFERIFGTNLLRGCKSEKGIWPRAFAQIPADPSEIGTIGDNPVEDGELPRSCGAGQTVIIPREEIARGIDRKDENKSTKGITKALLLAAGIFAGLISAGCTSMNTFKLEMKDYKAEFVNPQGTTEQEDCGRFCKGGWLLDVKDKKTGKGIFYTSTTIPDQHAYGLPDEFWHPIPTDRDRYYNRIGVGLVKRRTGTWAHPFYDLIRKPSPWFCEPIKEGNATNLYYHHYVPGVYFFRKNITVTPETNTISYRYRFLNLSSKPIKTDVYWHSFLRCGFDEKPWMKGYTEKAYLAKGKPSLDGWPKDTDKLNGETYFEFGIGKRLIGTFHIPGATKLVLWHQVAPNFPDYTVFAVEPKIEYNFQPQKWTEWKWEFILPDKK